MSLRTDLAAGRDVGATPLPRRRSHFWCALMEQEVEVEFEMQRLLGFSTPVGVRRCSAFDPPEAVACRRRCLDHQFRRQWPPALPVAGPGAGTAA
jgi:hypothetical protein